MQATARRSAKKDRRDTPAYTYVDASRALNIPATTIGAWVRGQEYSRKDGVGYFEPVIVRPDPNDTRLSFNNLIEAHVLRMLRTVHDVSMGAVREALDVAQTEFDVQRLLIHRGLRFSAGDLFLEHYQQLVSLTRSQQFVLKKMMDIYLERVEYDDEDLPREFYPLLRGPEAKSPRTIALNPGISFGRPAIAGKGISTSAISTRFEAGEHVAHIAVDYSLNVGEVEEAVRYEAAA